jgi:hypothetical protein
MITHNSVMASQCDFTATAKANPFMAATTGLPQPFLLNKYWFASAYQNILLLI